VARTFVAASSRYLEGAAPLTAVPLTVACWFRPAASPAGSTLSFMQLGNSAAQKLFLLGQSTAGVIVQAYDGTTAGSATTTAQPTAAVWSHAAGVFASNSDRRVYLNGGNKSTDATATTPTGIDKLDLGAYVYSGGHILFFDGDLAEAGIWNVALDDFDVASLAAGLSPLLVRPSALVGYWPLIGTTSPEIDLRGRVELAVTGATAAPHPRIIRPATGPEGWRQHTFRLSGVTKNLSGVALPGCTVRLFRTSDNACLGSTISDGSGNYAYPVPGGVPLYAVAYLAGSPDVAGVTDNTLVGV
jgi:hypothetical protein